MGPWSCGCGGCSDCLGYDVGAEDMDDDEIRQREEDEDRRIELEIDTYLEKHER